MHNQGQDTDMLSEEHIWMFEKSPLPMWIFDRSTHSFLAVNAAALQQYGYSRTEFLSLTFPDVGPPEDAPSLRAFTQTMSSADPPLYPVSAGVWRHRKKDGTIMHVEMSWSPVTFQGKQAIVVVAQDITERLNAQDMIDRRNLILELIATRKPLGDILKAVTQIIERHWEGVRCSILVVDEEGQRLRAGVAPSFPEGFLRAIDGVPIGASQGPCAWAASSGEPVLIENIATETRWPAFQELVTAHDVKACWSCPIKSNSGKVLATMCLYFREPRGPSHAETAMAEITAQMAAVAIEREQAHETLTLRTEQLQAITEAMTQFLEDGDWREVSARLLRAALKHTQSEYGFIGVVVSGPVLRILAHEGLIWDRETNRDFYERALRTYQEVGFLEFRSLQNLFGTVVTTGQVVLTNDPSSDPRSGGVPPGHPPLRHFLGVPVLRKSEVVGMIGVANRPGGYSGSEQERLEILTQAAGVLFDSYRRQQRETELESYFRQAQKLEAIGRLAGGIAHDFNNLLTAMRGECEVLLMGSTLGDWHFGHLTQLKQAIDRAALLTRQLLAFSRQQVLQEEVVNLNAVVSDLNAMLRRVIGEHIELLSILDPALPPVKVDPGQLQQVIMNLVLNSRDALPNGGTIVIETASVDLDQHYAHRLMSLPAGPYVRLVVSDNGCGMDAETKARIFEPFFTTKEPGRGTGLGLASVYGIVKQSQGGILVYSELGRGTTFKIYLPALVGDPVRPTWRSRAGHITLEDEVEGPVPDGSETILLVEDEAAVRRLARFVLEGYGYTVLEARDGAEALQTCMASNFAVDLLVTDVIMPNMSGHALARQLKILYPNLAVLYISGYTDEAITRFGILEAKAPFLQKPFAMKTLARKVREVLDSLRRGSGLDLS